MTIAKDASEVEIATVYRIPLAVLTTGWSVARQVLRVLRIWGVLQPKLQLHQLLQQRGSLRLP